MMHVEPAPRYMERQLVYRVCNIRVGPNRLLLVLRKSRCLQWLTQY